MAGACVPIPNIAVDGPYKGKVVELETGEPIEGAVVAGSWSLEYFGGRKECFKETVTDKNGEFVLPTVICISPFLFRGDFGHPDVIVFKPGYLGYPPPDRNNSIFTGDEFTTKSSYNVIRLGKATRPGERGATLMGIDFSFFPFASNVEFKKQLPLFFELRKQEEEYLDKEGKRYMYINIEGPAVVPPITR
ncbi:lipoprotein [Candidatus Magnetobacterium bavaricum]|uniref:Lipoprotein n=1 Tax=Candidatus Magnetobacterium bavaricum TaxID=29290 RepID=A0A0F3GQ58_9BACT|nr:lipoprotein [Candidatus Magnetobacterium bavaricum]